ncbi:MAG: DUF6538 domain-containing protein, partial [Desulfobulbia bacterium]
MPKYLLKNSFGIYHFRVKVPAKLRSVIGKTEIKKSLRTKNKIIAERRAQLLAAYTEYQFMTLSKKELEQLMRLSSQMLIKGVRIDRATG